MSLLDLPQELLYEVTSTLSYVDIVALRWTCHELHGRIRRPRWPTKEPSSNLMSYLLEIEKWKKFCSRFSQAITTLDFFACSECLKIRDAIHFSNTMMRGKRGKKCLDDANSERHKRRCIECCIRDGSTKPGVVLYFGGGYVWRNKGGGRGFVCRECGSFHRFRDTVHEVQICALMELSLIHI